METLVANLAGQLRYAELHGRRYLVAPLTLIVPGVLNGSRGPLLYPADELARTPQIWNGMPIVWGHPMRNGEYVSGRDPNVYASHGLGTVYNVEFKDRLRGEGWFDEEVTRRVAPAVLEALQAGRHIELSTGLDHTPVQAPSGSTHNGRAYVAVARNYKPDHLAVFIGQQGACSISDGCGVFNSACGCGGVCGGCTEGLMNKEQLVTWLTANVSYWQGQEAVLNGMEVPQLQRMYDSSIQMQRDVTVANAARRGFTDPNGNYHTWDERAGHWVRSPAPGVVNVTNSNPSSPPSPQPSPAPAPAPTPTPSPSPSPAPTPEGVTANATPPAPPAPSVPVARPLTEAEWMATAPPAVRSSLERLADMDRQEKQRLVDQLTVNLADRPEERQRVGNSLFGEPVEKLRLLASLVAQQPAPGVPSGYVPGASVTAPSYAGAAGGPPYGLTANEQQDVLDIDAARAQYDPWRARPAATN